MYTIGTSTARRLVGLAAAIAFVAASLAGCSSDAPSDAIEASAADRTAEMGVQFGDLGIAVVPFEGGDPLYDVTGEIVLTLTDWQLSSIAAATPPAPEGEDVARQWSGVATEALDGITAALPPIAGAESLTPTSVIQAWWRATDTSRAAAARDMVPAPVRDSTGTIPSAVLALFVADGLADAGRVVEPSQISVAMGDGDTRILALGTDVAVPLADVDPCDSISSAIADVNEFLDSMGELGSVMKGAITEAVGALDAASGGVISAIKRVIAVANLVLNTASLLTPWTVSLAIDPPTGQVVAFDKAASVGTTSTVTVSLDGVAATPPAGVQSCLGLLGIVDPTSQQGSDLTWGSWDGFVDRVSPSLITPPANGGPSRLGADNTASMTVGSGVEVSDAKKHLPVVDTTPSITVSVERADVKKLTSWIRAQDSAIVQSVLGGTLEAIATAVELAANPNSTTLQIPVGYWVPDETPDPDPADVESPPVAQPPADPPAPPGPENLIDCMDYRIVEQIMKVKVTRIEYGEWDGMKNPFVSGEKVQACKYYVGGSGSMVVIEQPFFIANADAATDAGFMGILNERGCSLASGLLDTGKNVTSYFVYSGDTLGGTFLYQLEVNQSAKKLRTLAAAAGLC